MADEPKDPNVVTWKEASDFNVARRQLDSWRTVARFDRIYADLHPGDAKAQARAVREEASCKTYEEKNLRPLQERFFDHNTGKPIGEHLRGEILTGANGRVDIDEVRKMVSDSRDDDKRTFTKENGLMHTPVGDGAPHEVTHKEIDHMRHWMIKDQALDKAHDAVMAKRAAEHPEPREAAPVR
jgi:hypothetical protein